MKRIVILLLMLNVCLFSLQAQTNPVGTRFSYPCVDGQILWYSVTSDTTAEVTNGPYNFGGTPIYQNLIGNIYIPSEVVYNGTAYSVDEIYGKMPLKGAFTMAASGGCLIDTVFIPNSVTYIKDAAFEGVDLYAGMHWNSFHGIAIGNSVTSIGAYAFYENHHLGYVKLGSSLKHIWYAAFWDCWGLEKVVYDGTLADWMVYWHTIAANDSVRNLETGYPNDNGAITLFRPWEPAIHCFPNNGLWHQPYLYLGGTKVIDVEIPFVITEVPSHSFKYYSDLLHSVVIPNHVISVGDSLTFEGTRNLVTLGTTAGAPWGAKHWGTDWDPQTGLFYLDNTRTTLFGGKSTITTIDVPATVRTISEEAFMDYDSLLTVRMNDSIDTIERLAFANCTVLDTVRIPHSVSFIGDSAFLGVPVIHYNGDLPGAPWGALQLVRDSCTVTLNTEGSTGYVSISLANSATRFVYGQTITLFATGTDSTWFVMWSDSVTESQRTFTVTCDTSFTAIFAPKSRISIVVDSNGIATGNGWYTPGDTATLTAMGNYGYRFMRWNDGSTDNPRHVAVDGDSLFTAIFTVQHRTCGNQYDFENADADSLWTLLTGGRPNGWAIGSAAHNGGGRGLYISNDGGTNNAASSAASSVFAYTTIQLKPGICHVRYDWRSGGDNFNVYMRMALVSTNIDITPGQRNYNWDYNRLPSGAISIDGNQCLSGTDTWQTVHQTAVIPQAGEYRLVLNWSNWGVSSSQPPAAVDNIVIYQEQPWVTVAVASSDTMMGAVTGGDTVLVGDTVTIAATPSPRHFFVRWDDNSTDNPRTITVTQDTMFTAYFAMTIVDTVTEHDTTYIDVHDTTYIDVFVHDTTFIDVFVHDTTYINVPYPVHDTTYIDVFVHDTTYVNVPYPVHDTTYIDVYVHDTTIVTDTLRLTQYDTIWLHDTIIIHDTIYITHEGIDGAEAFNVKVYSNNGQIVVEGARNNIVTLYDVTGRKLTNSSTADKLRSTSPNLGKELLRIDVPVSGTYLIKVGNYPARKVVVIR